MAATLVTPHWEDIRRLAEQGVPIPLLAERYGLAEKTIYNKSASEDWFTPHRVKAKINRVNSTRINDGSIMGESPLLGGAERAEKSDSLLLETWETRAADLRNLAYGVAVQAIKESKGQIVIESASDLKHAVHVARQATGILDTDAPQIQLSLFASTDICGPAIMENHDQGVIDLQPVSEVDDFWG